MAKEFEINDILNAVDNISKIERKKGKTIETKNDSADKNGVLTLRIPKVDEIKPEVKKIAIS